MLSAPKRVPGVCVWVRARACGAGPGGPIVGFQLILLPTSIRRAMDTLGWAGLELWLCFTGPLGLAWGLVGCLGLGEGQAPRALACGDGSLCPLAALGGARSSGAAGGDGKAASVQLCTSRSDC